MGDTVIELNFTLFSSIAVAEELEVKPAILKKAIKLAHKAEFGKEKQDHETLETILETVGKTL